MPQTTLDFLGTSSCRPDLGNDTASFVVNRQVLVDTGWCSVQNMRECGIDPAAVPYLVFTHMHHDHYLSLPSLLFYHLCIWGNLDHLTILAPKEDSELVVNRAMDFLQVPRFYPGAKPPKLIKLSPGSIYETDDFVLQCAASLHAVEGLCYRYLDRKTQTVIGFTGDTAYKPELSDFFVGCDSLIHECSLGPVAAIPGDNARYLHSGACDAAQVAKEAGVGQLILLHGTTTKRDACIEAAQDIFKGPISWPERGETYHWIK